MRSCPVQGGCSTTSLTLSSSHSADTRVPGRGATAIVSDTGMAWVVYILECTDGSLYTGITNDLERRMTAHRMGKGAKYTKHRGPFILRYIESLDTKNAALQREAAIKLLDRSAKVALITSNS